MHCKGSSGSNRQLYSRSAGSVTTCHVVMYFSGFYFPWVGGKNRLMCQFCRAPEGLSGGQEKMVCRRSKTQDNRLWNLQILQISTFSVVTSPHFHWFSWIFRHWVRLHFAQLLVYHTKLYERKNLFLRIFPCGPTKFRGVFGGVPSETG